MVLLMERIGMINKEYLRKENLDRIKEIFRANKTFPSVTLRDFIDEKAFLKMKNNLARMKFKDNYNPLFFSYKRCESGRIVKDFFNSEVISFIEEIIGMRIKKPAPDKFMIFSFGWKDYTVLNDKTAEKDGVDLIFDFTDGWDERFGGAVVYSNGKDDFLRISSMENTLSIVERKNSQRFVQYVNHYAEGRSKLFILISL